MTSNALISLLQVEIETAQNARLPFARFMEIALYHPRFGYYNQPHFTIGAQGDFTTAPEISPLFAKCCAQQCAPILAALKQKNVLEIGAGTGRFAKDFMLQLAHLGTPLDHYYILELSPHLQKQQADLFAQFCPQFLSKITWLSALPAQFEGVILANEVLDALPIHCFRIDETIQERFVTFKDNHFAWKNAAPTSAHLSETVKDICARYHLPLNYESEVNLHLPAFIKALSQSLKQGIILLIDYGYGAREYYHPERTTGTLSCFYQHQKNANPFAHIGLQDITAHVNFTAVAEIAHANALQVQGFTTQSAFLLALGLLDFAQAQSQHLSSKEEFALHQAIKILTMPTEMGERIKVMALSKNIDLALQGFSFQDRKWDL